MGGSGPAMDARIQRLAKTTFAGQSLRHPTIAEIRDTVALLPPLGWTELAQTDCEDRDWPSPCAGNRI